MGHWKAIVIEVLEVLEVHGAGTLMSTHVPHT
jgi:hypothetical protein